MQQTRLPELDLLRAAALLAVLVIHAAAWSAPVGAGPLDGPLPFLADLARCSVPIFVVASGFGLRLGGGSGAPGPGWLGKRLKRTLLPWACWAPVFFTIGATASPSGAGMAGDWLAGGGGHLYFLLLIAQLYLLFLVLPAGTGKLAVIAGAALAIQAGLDVMHTYTPLAAPRAYWQASYYAGYFLAGTLLADLRTRIRGRTALALAATAGAVPLWLVTASLTPPGPLTHGAYAFLWPGRIPLVLALCVLTIAAAPTGGRLAAAVEWLGKRSLAVYLTHPLFLLIAGPAALAMLGAWPRFLLLWSGSLAFGCVAATLLLRTRLGAAAVGENRQQPGAAQRTRTRPALA